MGSSCQNPQPAAALAWMQAPRNTAVSCFKKGVTPWVLCGVSDLFSQGCRAQSGWNPPGRAGDGNRSVAEAGAHQPCDTATPCGITAPGEDVQFWIRLQTWWELKSLPSFPHKTVVDLWAHSFALQAEQAHAVHLSQPTSQRWTRCAESCARFWVRSGF